MKLLASTGVTAALLAAFGMACAPAASAAPTYTWSNAKIGGTGYVDGFLAHPGQQGLFYAKTDVGGAYRYDASTSTWIPLNDWLPPSLGYAMGVDSIAVDPNDARKFYMVGGGGYGNGTDKAVFMASSDQGRSFTTLKLQFSAGGNESGRQAGEKLQVDPNNGNILFYGTGNASANAATNGIWKSVDGGQTWNRLPNFNVLTSDGTGAGIAFIAFRKESGTPGNATPTIYVGVNTQGAADSGIPVYKSTDGGNSWSRLWGGPTAGAFPQRGQIGPDGYLYVTFARAANYGQGNNYGPGGLIGGEVWKIDVASQDQWVDVTPPGPVSPKPYGFAGLSVDPWRPGWLTVNTIDWYSGTGAQVETMYRSTDGGAHWTDILPNAHFDTSAEPWRTANGPVNDFGNWGGSILDPYDVNHAFVSFGGGIWETKNLTAAGTNWAYGENGVAETAILDLKSPLPNVWNAYPVLTGAGDVCGFTNMDVNAYPQFPFTGPSCKDTTSLDYAKTDSRLVVRVGTDDWQAPANRHFGAVSYNGGYSWNAFGSNGPSAAGGGHVAVSTDTGTNPATTSIIWSAWNTPTVRSTDMGNSWQTIGVPQSALIAADGADPTVFYAYDRPSGILYLSNSRGASWWAANSSGSTNGVPAWSDNLVTPAGVRGDVWLVNWQGLYHNNNWGQGAWTKLANVSAAKALGFGKAAAGASYPAMYLSGTVGGVQGIFRSTDTGQNWVRIDDAQHQYGAATVITGDPKEFGTIYLGGRGLIVGKSAN